MRHDLARAFYSHSVDHPMIDYRNPKSRFNIERMKKQLEAVIRPGRRVLDLGCNTGRHSFHAETLGATAVGVDCAIEALAVASKIKRDIGGDARFVGGDLNHLPFRDDAFDLAVFPENIILFSVEEMRRLADRLSCIKVKCLLTAYKKNHPCSVSSAPAPCPPWLHIT